MLVNLSEVKTYLGESTTSYDDFLVQQINLFSSAIENYCSRKFLSSSYTQTFYYSDFMEDEVKKKLFLFHFPIQSIEAVREITTFNEIDTTVILPTSTYRLNPKIGTLLRVNNGMPCSWFSESGYFSVSGFNSRIEVDFESGYDDTPLEIKDVVFSLINERYSKKKSGVDVSFGNDVQRISIPGTMSIDFDYSLQANERKTKFGMLLGNYINVLDYFRSERALIGEIKESYVSES